MGLKDKILYVVNHTHWDREWYQTFEQFRYRLKNAVEHIVDMMEEGQMETFLFDGQTIILEDYKEVADGEDYERLLSLITKKQIEVGPWYVLPDEFLISGESLLRNLQIGIQTSKRLGSDYQIGYLPDTFGHISQLPQIFRGMGIDTALIFRGALSKHTEVTWIGADQTQCLTIVLPLWEGYYQPFLSEDAFKEKTKEYTERIEPFLNTSEMLLLHGADHMVPAKDIKWRIGLLNNYLENTQVKECKMSTYVKTLSGRVTKEQIAGEQRNCEKAYILPGVLSARSYLKVQNQQCEDLLTGWVEPVDLLRKDKSNCGQFITHLWKTLIKNHPHDSICGCSIDEVHEEMEMRSKKIMQAGNSFVQQKMNTICHTDLHQYNDYLYVFYPHLHENHSVYIETEVTIPVDKDTGNIGLYEGDTRIAIDVLRSEKREVFVSEMEKQPNWYPCIVYTIGFVSSFDGMQLKAFHITQEPVEKRLALLMTTKKHIENEYYKIEISSDETLRVYDKKTGLIYDNLHQITSTLDCGDEYTYCPPTYDCMTKATMLKAPVVTSGKSFETISISQGLNMPQELDAKRDGAADDTVLSEIFTKITLCINDPVIHFKTTVDNKAKDHRLRVGFPLSKKADCSYGDTPFDLVERPVLCDIGFHAGKQKEVPVNTHPSSSVVYAEGIGVLHGGLQEYEVGYYDENRDAIYMTLMRCVGWLSRDDFSTRGGGAGPKMPTPQAQCIGTYTFDYGLTLAQPKERLINLAKQMRIKCIVNQGLLAEIPSTLCALDNPDIVVTACKKNEMKHLIVRLFNPATKQKACSLTFGRPLKKVWESNLLDEPVQELIAESHKISLSLKPKQIYTLTIEQ